MGTSPQTVIVPCSDSDSSSVCPPSLSLTGKKPWHLSTALKVEMVVPVVKLKNQVLGHIIVQVPARLASSLILHHKKFLLHHRRFDCHQIYNGLVLR